MLEQITVFEEAYEQLIELHAKGKLGVGKADFSAENLDRVRRIRSLIGSCRDTDEARRAAQEIHTLATDCMRALTGGQGEPGPDADDTAAPLTSQDNQEQRAREVAEAMCDGLNILAKMASGKDRHALDRMRQALETSQSARVTTSTHVQAEDVEMVKRVCRLLEECEPGVGSLLKSVMKE